MINDINRLAKIGFGSRNTARYAIFLPVYTIYVLIIQIVLIKSTGLSTDIHIPVLKGIDQISLTCTYIVFAKPPNDPHKIKINKQNRYADSN